MVQYIIPSQKQTHSFKNILTVVDNITAIGDYIVVVLDT